MAEEKIRTARGGNPKYTWDDTVAAIGKDFSGGNEWVADEVIEYASVVRFCEPWEIGNPIYWSEQVAKQLGYRGVVAPITALRGAFTRVRAWRPGEETRFPSPKPNVSFSLDMPAYPRSDKEVPMPPYDHAMFANMEIEFFEPACVGDRLTTRGDKLVNVRPRKTRVGVGAFVTREHRIFNQRDELVARYSMTVYWYNRE